jgi:cellulose synthase/poly-beta-1,6-N-acetylglucosamine synthase-like glycosyltransferase
MVRVSIVMAVYNGAAHLAKTIESIERQTFSDWELIIVNDASSDETQQIAEHYQQRDSRIQIISNAQNCQLASSLNRGIAHARADLIARHDCSDLSQPNRLQQQYDLMAQNSALVLLGSCYDVLTPSGDYLSTIELPLHDTALRAQLAKGNPFSHGSVMFRRAAFEQCGGYRTDFAAAQDYELWMRLAQWGEIQNLPESLYAWRLELDSTTIRKFDVQYAYMRCAQIQCDQEAIATLRSQAPVIENLLSWLALTAQTEHTALAEEISEILWKKYGESIRQRQWMIPHIVKLGVRLARENQNFVGSERFVRYALPHQPQQRGRAMRRITYRVSQLAPNWRLLFAGLLRDYRSWHQIGLLALGRLARCLLEHMK